MIIQERLGSINGYLYLVKKRSMVFGCAKQTRERVYVCARALSRTIISRHNMHTRQLNKFNDSLYRIPFHLVTGPDFSQEMQFELYRAT